MPAGYFEGRRVPLDLESTSAERSPTIHGLDFEAGPGTNDKILFSLGPVLGSGASSCVFAVTAETFADRDAVQKVKSLRGGGFAAKFFRRDKNPEMSALEREIKTLATLPKSPYIAGFHGQFSVKLEDPSLAEVWTKLAPRKRDAKDVSADDPCESEKVASFILVDRCDCPLTSLIQKTAFSEAQSAFAMTSLLRGISHLHSQRVVHRDIKDLNILVADAGRRVCLCDFDLATRIPEDQEIIEWKGGTPGYMAPEVCNYGKASFAADLFSAGVVMHVLLTRSNPFLPEHAGLKVQGSSPMDYDMLRLFRSEGSCHLLYSLLEIDAEMRPSAADSMDFAWFFELVPQSLCKLLADPDREKWLGEESQMTRRKSQGLRSKFGKRLQADTSTWKSPPGSHRSTAGSMSSVLSKMGSAARSFFERPSRRQSKVVPIQEFDEVCSP